MSRVVVGDREAVTVRLPRPCRVWMTENAAPVTQGNERTGGYARQCWGCDDC